MDNYDGPGIGAIVQTGQVNGQLCIAWINRGELVPWRGCVFGQVHSVDADGMPHIHSITPRELLALAAAGEIRLTDPQWN